MVLRACIPAGEGNDSTKRNWGAQNDLDQVTKMAYSMVAVYGMNDKVGNVSFYGMSQDQFNKPYSDDTATKIDDEVRKIAEEQYARAQELLNKHRSELDILAQELLAKEVLLKSDVERLIGPRPFSVVEVNEGVAVSDTDGETVVKTDDTTEVKNTEANPSDDEGTII